MQRSQLIEIVGTAQLVVNIGLFCVPLKDAFELRASKSSPPILSYTGLLLNALLWGIYGIVTRNWVPLFWTSVLGVTAIAASYKILLDFASDNDRKALLSQTGVIVIVASLLCTLCADALVEGTSLGDPEWSAAEPELVSQAQIAGRFATFSSLCMYGFPLATVRQVVNDGNTASMSAKVTGMSFLNSGLFLIYGIMVMDENIIQTGAIAFALASLQVGLMIRFGGPHGCQNLTLILLVVMAGASVFCLHVISS